MIRCQPGQGTDPTAPGTLRQWVDAAGLRGQRIRFRAWLRLEAGQGAEPGLGRCFLRVERSGGNDGFFDNMEDRAVRSPDWTPVEIVGDVADDAVGMDLGAFVQGSGRLWIRGPVLEALGPAPPEPRDPPRRLDPGGLGNLEALAKAMGYIRYFHPSDSVLQTDWNRFACKAVRSVEAASTPQALALILQDCFDPIAPTVRFRFATELLAPLRVPREATQVVRWEHHGLGLVASGPYHSDRLRRPLGSLPPEWQKALVPLNLELGCGVTLGLPTALYARADGATLPGTPSPSDREGLPEPTAWIGSAEDRAVRLGAVCLAWAAAQHFYPYFDRVPVSWGTELTKALAKAALDRDEQGLLTTLRQMNAALRDGHGQVEGSGPRPMVPDLALILVGGKVRVRACGMVDQPIPKGSEVLRVEGEPVERVLARLRPERSAPSQVWLDTRLQQELLQGPPGTQVQVAYRAPSGCLGQSVLTRTTPPAQVRWLDLPPPVAELRPGIWYLDLERLDTEAFLQWLRQPVARKGILFDLRGYPRLSPVFLQHLTSRRLLGIPAEVPVVTMPDRRGWGWDGSGRLTLEPLPPLLPGKWVFLAGGGSASYAESCLALVKAYGLGRILGEPSAGANGRAVSLLLPCGITMTFTGMRVRNYDGTRFHGVGVRPDRIIRPTLLGLTEGRDELLQKAVARVSSSWRAASR